MTFRHVQRGGRYYRVVDPAWVDPSDTSYSKKKGGRWNEPDRPGQPGFGALYLNASVEVARFNARRAIAEQFGTAVGPDDLNENARPQLQHYDILESTVVNAVTPHGIAILGLSSTYPHAIPHPLCQGIGAAAYAADETGVAALSAVGEDGQEELVLFDRAVPLVATKRERVSFPDWY